MKSYLLKITTACLLLSVSSYSLATPLSWAKTKEVLKREVMKTPLLQRRTLYLGCVIEENYKLNTVLCNITFKRTLGEIMGIHVEHMVPASRILTHVQCSGTRDSCRRTDNKFKACHNALVNLYPTLSIANQYRSNIPFSELKKEERFSPFGKSKFFFKHIKNRVIEPNDSAKPIVARAYLKMDSYNCIKLTEEERILFNKWVWLPTTLPHYF